MSRVITDPTTGEYIDGDDVHITEQDEIDAANA